VALTAFQDRMDPAVELTHDLVDGARYDLARSKPLLSLDDLDTAVMALTGGERDPQSQADAIVTLAGMPGHEIMRLTLPCRCCGVGLAAPGESMTERHALAGKGHALEDGSYPIPDRKHLHSAAVLAASGHGDVAAARRLIRRRAAELGVPLKSLPGFSDEDGDREPDQDGDDRPSQRKAQKAHPAKTGHATRPVQVTRRGQRVAAEGGGDGPSGGDGAAMTVTLSQDPTGYYLALAAQENVSSGPLVKHFDFEVHDTGSHPDSDNSSVDVDAEVKRYLGMCKEAPKSGNRSYRPLGAAARRRGEERELAGGRPQSYR
jgi:hypothetical protein